jgi:hypothetical protein
VSELIAYNDLPRDHRLRRDVIKRQVMRTVDDLGRSSMLRFLDRCAESGEPNI